MEWLEMFLYGAAVFVLASLAAFGVSRCRRRRWPTGEFHKSFFQRR